MVFVAQILNEHQPIGISIRCLDLRNHPIEGHERQIVSWVSASDVTVNARKPDLLDAFSIIFVALIPQLRMKGFPFVINRKSMAGFTDSDAQAGIGEPQRENAPVNKARQLVEGQSVGIDRVPDADKLYVGPNRITQSRAILYEGAIPYAWQQFRKTKSAMFLAVDRIVGLGDFV